MKSRWIAATMIAVAIAWPGASQAFERDTHYYSTFALALTTCVDWREAHLIASADVMVDGSHGTVAELNPAHRHNKAAWHAFGHSTERYYELWERVLLEEDHELRLIAFGQLLHFLQDWESHAGYPVHLGHAKATILGHDPDSMARSEDRTGHAVQATLDHLALLCHEMERLPAAVTDPDEALPIYLGQVVGNRLTSELIDNSDPAWRKTFKGGLTEAGRHIMAENVRRIEEYILAEVAPRPDKNVPIDFEPGTDAHGIPEPLVLDFDSDGRLLSDLDDHVARAGLQPEDDHLDPGDHHVRVTRAKPTKGGWKVSVEVTNVGDATMPSGELLAVAVDAVSEEHLGETATTIPAVGPDDSLTVKLKIPTTRTAETALIGVSFASKHDRDRHNSDIWHMTAEDLDELEDHVAAYGHLHGVSAIPPDASLEIVAPPKAWLTPGELLCTASVARGTSDDPTIHVTGPEFSILQAGGDGIQLTSAIPTVWTITPSHPGALPAVKAYACFDPVDAVCPHLSEAAADLRLELSVSLGNVRREAIVELGDRFRHHISSICGGRDTEALED